MTYKPTKKSLKAHPVPQWFDDAKLGLFVHWGLYSVPGWAKPRVNLQGIPGDNTDTPYAEWYANSMKIKGSPTWEYHKKTYGHAMSYADFRRDFLEQSAQANPAEWAEWAARIGAGYGLITTKHHDGYCLYPTEVPHPRVTDWNTKRDFIGEFASGLRTRGLRFGAYYSGIWDWSFQGKYPIQDEYSMLTNGDGSRQYANYCHSQFKELIDRYQPEVLYNDIGYPTRGRLEQLLAHYYNTVPDGVANNRWIRWRIPDNPMIRAAVRGILKLKDKFMAVDWGSTDLSIPFGDFATPEFLTLQETVDYKWETLRGLGSSFGYNRAENAKNTITGSELILLFTDIVSKNGNLAINIGPKADGSLPECQKRPLEELGAWMDLHQNAVKKTRPWKRAEGTRTDNGTARYVRKDKDLFIYLSKGLKDVVLEDLSLAPGSDAIRVSDSKKVEMVSTGNGTRLVKPCSSKDGAVTVLQIPEGA
ncbi:MAG: alpha-L-fucosidase [Spirochaetales bacterium]|nr:alpha-L-fucosidase [Spirochaetales bacterium]